MAIDAQLHQATAHAECSTTSSADSAVDDKTQIESDSPAFRSMAEVLNDQPDHESLTWTGEEGEILNELLQKDTFLRKCGQNLPKEKAEFIEAQARKNMNSAEAAGANATSSPAFDYLTIRKIIEGLEAPHLKPEPSWLEEAKSPNCWTVFTLLGHYKNGGSF
ncbi:unnamed protein product [Amoebophrya sp. A120]|nr:unnamed protein product [Amoebophrya sp. A120]|eukprot:GSA120T00015768001.1